MNNHFQRSDSWYNVAVWAKQQQQQQQQQRYQLWLITAPGLRIFDRYIDTRLYITQYFSTHFSGFRGLPNYI